MPAFTRRLGPLAEPDFRDLWLGQLVSNVGDRIATLALAFAVLDLTGSAKDLGLVLGASLLPMACFLLVGGVWADRLPRRQVVLASDLTRAALQTTAATLLLTGTARIWHLVVLAALFGTADAFFRPAVTGLVPQVVSAPRLQQANALMGLSFNIGTVAGPTLAGVLVALVRPGGAIAVDAASFVVSAALLVRVRPREHERAERTSFRGELTAGLREVTSRRWLAAVVVGYFVYHFVVLPGVLVLGPLVADRDYGGATAWSVVSASFGGGAVLGGLFALRHRPGRPMLFCAVLLGVGACQPLFIGTGLPLAAIAVLEAVAGAAISALFAVWDSTLAERVPPQALSRVSSFDHFGSVVGMPLGFALVGPIAETFGVRPVMVTLSVIGVAWAAGTAALTDVRQLRALDPPAPHPAQQSALHPAGTPAT